MNDNNEPEPLTPPQPTPADRGVALVRGAFGGVPLVGGILQEAFAAVLKSPLERRKERWMEAVGSRLLRLEEIGITLDDLAENEVFVSVVVNATQAAMRTHDEAQLQALRNAVINAACPDAPDDAVQLQFVSLVDQLSGWHLRLLAYLRDPQAALGPDHALMAVPLRDIVPGVEAAIPDLKDRREVILQLYEELYARRLVAPRNPRVASRLPALAKRTTKLGDAMLDYITREPISPEQQ